MKSEIVDSKIQANQASTRLLILDEQNRIANEIHDTVSQRLFGIVYALHSLQGKLDYLSKDKLKDELLFLSQSANSTLKELQSVIFALSSTKKELPPLSSRLGNYLNEYARLHDVQINYQLIGNEEILSDELQHALYRITCEACGNAMRHGASRDITVQLSISEEKTFLKIMDNGCGMKLNNLQKNSGLGLSNIQDMVRSFEGRFSIETAIGNGTTLLIEVPSILIQKKEEVI